MDRFFLNTLGGCRFKTFEFLVDALPQQVRPHVSLVQNGGSKALFLVQKGSEEVFDVYLLVTQACRTGLGSLQGAIVGSLMVGLLDNFGKALFPELSYFTLFAPMAVILAVRPTGLFGKG